MKKHFAYYNEFDPQAAQWLRNLIDHRLIVPGCVDERSIVDVDADDLSEFVQCHFFAGIGVWSYALRQAGWGDERPVWTGSCPCQPFSSAGKQSGFQDERHLWPTWAKLIEKCRPATIFGEQVASKDAEPWIDLVHTNLEAMGYAVGAVAFPSAGLGAPHIRDRLYWVGNANSEGLEGYGRHVDDSNKPGRKREVSGGSVATTGTAIGMVDPEYTRHSGSETNSPKSDSDKPQIGLSDGGCSPLGRLVNPDSNRRHKTGQCGTTERGNGFVRKGINVAREPTTGPVNGFWRASDWLYCRDNKWRPVEPGTFPLAHGATSRVVRLRAYGNAINAEAAKVFVQSAIEAFRDTEEQF